MKTLLHILVNRYIYLLLILVVAIVSCTKTDNPEPPLDPEVSNVSTAQGSLSGGKNTIITFTGKDFTTDLEKIEVMVNSKNCEIVSATSTAISAKIPPACGTGLIELFIEGKRFEGPVFTYNYTYTLSSVTNGIVGVENGPLSTAKFDEIVSVSIDEQNNMYIGQYSYAKVRKISPDSIASILAGSGVMGLVDGNGTSAQFMTPEYTSPGPDGNLYVADDKTIRKIDAAGNVSTIYTSPTSVFMGIKAMPGGIYAAFDMRISKISYDGDLVWELVSNGKDLVDGDSSIAQFTAHANIEVDSLEQNIFFCNRMRSGTGIGSSQVRKYNITDQTITTIAGNNVKGFQDGPALQSSFNTITDIKFDKAGDLWIADGLNDRIRLLKDGVVSTVIGAAGPGDVDGDISVGKIDYPTGIYFNQAGHLYIACAHNNKLKRLLID